MQINNYRIDIYTNNKYNKVDITCGKYSEENYEV